MNRKRKDLLNDKSLLEKSNYEIITNEELTKDDISQISQLYNQLYIENIPPITQCLHPLMYGMLFSIVYLR